MNITIRHTIASFSIFLFSCNDSSTQPTQAPIEIAARVGTSTFTDVKLQKYWRYFNPAIIDHMAQASEQTITGYNNEGLSWYIISMQDNHAGTTTLYRHYNNGDHMTSPLYSVSGYTNEGSIGKLTQASDPDIGLKPFIRYFVDLGNKLDHLDALPNESPSGYTLEGTQGYAWYTQSRTPDVENTSTISQITSSDLTVGSSFAWGAPLFKFSKQILNT